MYRNNDVLRLAQGERCLLEIHRYCQGDLGETTVAAHSNSLIDGKGKGLKAEDSKTVWACVRCHTMLDQSMLTKTQKKQIFDEAHEEQIKEWENIAKNPLLRPWKVEAAKDVLKQLGII